MHTTALHSGIICVWNNEQVSILDSISGTRLSRISIASIFSSNNNNNTKTFKEETNYRLLFVGSSPPYAVTRGSANSRIRRQTASAMLSLTPIMLIVENNNSSSLHAIFAVAETAEILGSCAISTTTNKIKPRSSSSHSKTRTNSTNSIADACCVPLFGRQRKKKLLTNANQIAWVIRFADGELLCGNFFKKSNFVSSSAQQEQQNQWTLTSSSTSASSSSSSKSLAVAFSVDASNDVAVLQSVEEITNNNNSSSSIVVKEYQCKSVPPVSTTSKNEEVNDEDGDSSSATTSAVKQQQQQQVCPFSLAWTSQPVTGDKSTEVETILQSFFISFSSASSYFSTCFLRIDTRQVDTGTFICYIISSVGIIAVVLTPESTSSYGWLFSASASSSPQKSSNLTTTTGKSQKKQQQQQQISEKHHSSPRSIVGAQLFEKSNSASSTIGILVADDKNDEIGVCFISFPDGQTPLQHIHQSWNSSSSSSLDKNAALVLVAADASSAVADIIPQNTQLYLASFSSSSSQQQQQQQQQLHLFTVGFAEEENNTSTVIVLDRSYTCLSSAWCSDRLWSNSRDVMVSTTNNNNISQSNISENYNYCLAIRCDTDALTMDIDIAEWLKWHRVGETLSTVAKSLPNVLFLLSFNNNNNNSEKKIDDNNDGDDIKIVSARWPAPVLRNALKTIGGESVRLLIAGLLDNFYQVASQRKNSNKTATKATAAATNKEENDEKNEENEEDDEDNNNNQQDQQDDDELKTTTAVNKKGYCFALACAVKVVESCVTMQRALGVNLDSVVQPFLRKLEFVENKWGNFSSIGYRISGVSALAAFAASSSSSSQQQKNQNQNNNNRVGEDSSSNENNDNNLNSNNNNNNMELDFIGGEDFNATKALILSSSSCSDDVSSVIARMKKVRKIPDGLF